VQNFSSVIGDLQKIFEAKELAAIIRDFVGSFPPHDPSLKLLNTEKLHLIHALVKSDIFLQAGMLI
jgi:hypothetical protein